MKSLFLAVILLSSVTIQAQKSTKSVSFSLKEKVGQLISDNFSRDKSETTKSFELSLVPNPVTSHLHVNSTGKLKKILLINSEGKVVKRVRLQNAKSHTFDTSSLEKGNYKVVISHYNQKKTEFLRRI